MNQFIFLIAFLWTAQMSGWANAADIEKSLSAECVVEINGPIETGDYKKFIRVAERNFPEFNDESTSPNVVCLNSPGGSLSEGVLFAKHFLIHGVSTYIKADNSCYSACAIMFMMGSFQGDELRGISRKLHVGGRLGFHRPYLRVKSDESDESISVKALEVVYDKALQSSLDLISIANSKAPWSSEPMMKFDLIEAMLAHIGNDFFEIDTVDKAGRWAIELVGFEDPPRSLLEKAFYGCENALQWKVATTKSEIALEFVYLNSSLFALPVKMEPAADGGAVLSITGLDSGYVGEWCLLRMNENYLSVCGVDENTGVSVGSNECSLETNPQKYEYLPPLTQLYPSTTLKHLRNNTPSFKSAKCYVFKQDTLLDDKPCFASFGNINAPNDLSVVFLWPSGAKTVIEVTDAGHAINGVKSEANYKNGFDRCWLNSSSGNTFCYKKGA